MMNRRNFAQASALGAIGASLAQTGLAQQSANTGGRFKLNYAPHFGMFRHSAGDDLLDQLRFAADQGFRAWEDNGMKGRSVEMQEKIARTMAELDMKMGVFVAHGDFSKISFSGTDKDLRNKVVENIKESVEVAKRVNAKWMTVVLDALNPRLEMGYQMAHTIDLLRRCAEVFEPHDMVMVMEPLNWWTDHPGLFLSKIPQAFEICRGVDSPACKILFDVYHQQIQEGNLIPNIDLAWEEIGYFQVGDNPGRNEPGTGEINYGNVFRHIHARGFEGVVGMEHGNSQEGKEGEQSVIDAYLAVDAAY